MSEQEQAKTIHRQACELEQLRKQVLDLSNIAARQGNQVVENQAIKIHADRDSEHIDLAIDEFHFSAPLCAMSDPDVRDAFAKGRHFLELKIVQLKRKESIHEVS